MNMTAFFSSFAEALGWTLLHSLWQGLIVLGGLLIGLALSRNSTSHTRYMLSCVAMVILVSWMGVTFGSYFQWNSYDDALVFITEEYPAFESDGTIFPVIQKSFEDNMRIFVAGYASELVSLWFLGVLFFSVRWGGSMYYTHQLRRKAVLEVPEYWQHQVQLLADKLGIYKPIKLLESARAEVPMVIGHLKPIILLPIGTLAGMTPQQLDAVLAHELAHVKRYDFLINFLLSLVEIGLFYHPVYWWIANQIKLERENCCDDMAVSICGNPKVYATALLSIEETRQHNSLAMALQGNKHQLLHRIKRICLSPPSSYRGESGKAGMALALLLFLAVVVWAKIPAGDQYMTGEPLAKEVEEVPAVPLVEEIEEPILEDIVEPTPPPVPEAPAQEAVQPEPPTPPLNITSSGGVALIIQEALGAVSHSEIDPPPLPTFPPVVRPSFPAYPAFPKSPESISQKLDRDPAYIESLRRTLENYKEEVRRWKDEYSRIFDDAWKSRQEKVQWLYEDWKRQVGQKYGTETVEYARTINAYAKAFEKALREQEDVMRESEDGIKKEMESSIRQLEDVLRTFEKQQADRDDRMKIHSDRMALHGVRMEVHGARMAMHGTRMDVHGQRMEMHGERMEAHGKIIDALKAELTSELIRDGLHRKGSDLEFRLETDQLIVNGTKLTGSAYQKYLRMVHNYIPNAEPGWGMSFGKNHSRIGTSVHKHKSEY